MARSTPSEPLSTGLRWFSAGLGTVQLAVPGLVNRAIGIAPSARNNWVMRSVGLQELGVALGLRNVRTTPAPLLWSRVAGDALHLGLLVTALRRPGNDRRRLLSAIGSVAGVGMLDVVAALRALGDASGAREIRTTVSATILRDPDSVYGYWRDLANLPTFMSHVVRIEVLDGQRSHWVAEAPGGQRVEWDAEIVQDVPGKVLAWKSLPGAQVPNAGIVRFAPAPGDRGTEVTVEFEFSPPAGAAGAGVAKLFGEHPEQQARDDVRRLKQVLEAGEVVRSDGSPEGLRTSRLVAQRPAQPQP
ncbi:SRPBCC family protein [Egicoccus sp. AB-alg2]|uniref:SRPBCC family protein n=1 Tax=Egicoccus sp. AB-alg2 TaxID=3242693 RepID=UPI00359E69F2